MVEPILPFPKDIWYNYIQNTVETLGVSDRFMGKILFSVIVPVLHESHRINCLIDHFYGLEAHHHGCEIIVVDGGPEADTIDAVRSDQVVTITAETGRARQMNAGAAVAHGEILIFLHVDTELPDGAFATIDGVARNRLARLDRHVVVGPDARHRRLALG